MKFDYDYRIQRLEPDGTATVEYVAKNEELGSVTKVFFVPYTRGPAAIHRKVAEKFPVEIFYGRWMELELHDTEKYLFSGSLSIDFEDHFYDIQEMMTCDAKSSDSSAS